MSQHETDTFLANMKRNMLSFHEYDLPNFVQFLSKQYHIDNINLKDNSCTFSAYDHKVHKWKVGSIVNENGIVTKNRTFHIYYTDFVLDRIPEFARIYENFFRGKTTAGHGIKNMLRLKARKCDCCGLPGDHPLLGSFTIEHKIAQSLGGDDMIENLEIMHKMCNALLENYPESVKEVIKFQIRKLVHFNDVSQYKHIKEFKNALMNSILIDYSDLLNGKAHLPFVDHN